MKSKVSFLIRCNGFLSRFRLARLFNPSNTASLRLSPVSRFPDRSSDRRLSKWLKALLCMLMIVLSDRLSVCSPSISTVSMTVSWLPERSRTSISPRSCGISVKPVWVQLTMPSCCEHLLNSEPQTDDTFSIRDTSNHVTTRILETRETSQRWTKRTRYKFLVHGNSSYITIRMFTTIDL